ncbi:hypothetical protein AGR4C_pa70029 [Agrobacterium tumefaciens str. Kerr 14]|uniref:Uncharacterized protein n=1 Tax=Agrobacterium tumefaciens str. Kerr 14 TaxID=1183424 RepID=A0A1S7SCZ4_AGRTU|nr:hypothetical protein AGR4C_pa70029 [Agrobacterium tumefaciens str. Kerr 14]
METVTEFNKLALGFIPFIVFGYLALQVGKHVLNLLKGRGPVFREFDRFEKKDVKLTKSEIFERVFWLAVLSLCLGGLVYSGVQLAPLFRSKGSGDF